MQAATPAATPVRPAAPATRRKPRRLRPLPTPFCSGSAGDAASGWVRTVGSTGRDTPVRGSGDRVMLPVAGKSCEVTFGPKAGDRVRRAPPRAGRLPPMTTPARPVPAESRPRLAMRLAALEAATRAVAAELDIDRVLGLIVDRVRELVGARYAALGIADPRGRIERFITSGIAPEARAAIGGVPQGHGLLGLIIREGRTVRAEDMRPRPARPRVPAQPPGHDVVPGRAGDGQGAFGRQPLPDGQARRGAVLGRRRAAGRDVRGPCGHRDRERPAPRPGSADGGGGGA